MNNTALEAEMALAKLLLQFTGWPDEQRVLLEALAIIRKYA